MVWLVALRIYVALAVFQPYRDLEAGDNQSLKFKWRGGELNPEPFARQAKSLTTRPPLLRLQNGTTDSSSSSHILSYMCQCEHIYYMIICIVCHWCLPILRSLSIWRSEGQVGLNDYGTNLKHSFICKVQFQWKHQRICHENLGIRVVRRQRRSPGGNHY